MFTWGPPGCVSDFQRSLLTCSAVGAQQELRAPCQSSLLEQQGRWEKLIPTAFPCQVSPLTSLCKAALGLSLSQARLEHGNWCWQRTWQAWMGTAQSFSCSRGSSKARVRGFCEEQPWKSLLCSLSPALNPPGPWEKVESLLEKAAVGFKYRNPNHPRGPAR